MREKDKRGLQCSKFRARKQNVDRLELDASNKQFTHVFFKLYLLLKTQVNIIYLLIRLSMSDLLNFLWGITRIKVYNRREHAAEITYSLLRSQDNAWIWSTATGCSSRQSSPPPLSSLLLGFSSCYVAPPDQYPFFSFLRKIWIW